MEDAIGSHDVEHFAPGFPPTQPGPGRRTGRSAGRAVTPRAGSVSDDELAGGIDWGELRVTFDDVAGLEAAKRQLRARRGAEAEGSGGGGLLFYGPPGCGKTMLGRAAAVERSARFVPAGAREILASPGVESGSVVRALFEDARDRPPAVLLIAGLEAARPGATDPGAAPARSLVDALAAELDRVAVDDGGVLVIGTADLPWNVAAALRGPGRLAPACFVPPPERRAREEILRRCLAKSPGGETVAVRKVARRSRLWTGADLVALCNRAADDALARTAATDEIPAVRTEDLLQTIRAEKGSAEDWLAAARRAARSTRERHPDLEEFLRRARRW